MDRAAALTDSSGPPDRMIALPDGRHIPAAPGQYRQLPPPDLNQVTDDRFLLEYDFPFLVVTEMATRRSSGVEHREAIRQAQNWRVQHPRAGGRVGGCREGFQFMKPPASRTVGHRYQFIPDVSYIDHRTWASLSLDEKRRAYLPCVPAVVIELMSETDKMEDLQAKVTKFIDAGTREGVVVDTRHERIWIYNRNEQPGFHELAPIVFDSWPNFTLDCLAIRDARIAAA